MPRDVLARSAWRVVDADRAQERSRKLGDLHARERGREGAEGPAGRQRAALRSSPSHPVPASPVAAPFGRGRGRLARRAAPRRSPRQKVHATAQELRRATTPGGSQRSRRGAESGEVHDCARIPRAGRAALSMDGAHLWPLADHPRTLCGLHGNWWRAVFVQHRGPRAIARSSASSWASGFPSTAVSWVDSGRVVFREGKSGQLAASAAESWFSHYGRT